MSWATTGKRERGKERERMTKQRTSGRERKRESQPAAYNVSVAYSGYMQSDIYKLPSTSDKTETRRERGFVIHMECSKRLSLLLLNFTIVYCSYFSDAVFWAKIMLDLGQN